MSIASAPLRLHRFGLVFFLSMICAAATARSNEPTGEEVIARFVEVTGGKEAYAKLKTRVSSGTLSMPQQNLTGQFTLYQQAPDHIVMTGDIGGMSFVRGFNGQFAYEANSAMGARIIEGEERQLMQQQALLDPLRNLKNFYSAIENLGVEQLDGQDAYKVELTMTSGQKVLQWFDTDSGLLVQMDMTIDSPVGQLEIKSATSDWREIGGIKVPFKTTQEIQPFGIEQTIEFTKVESNVEIPAAKFDLPEEVKDLVKDSETTMPATQPVGDRK